MTVCRITDAQAGVMDRVAGGETLVRSCVGERLWSFRDDPFTVLDQDDIQRLQAAGAIGLERTGSTRANRADAYGLTEAGRAALDAHRRRPLP